METILLIKQMGRNLKQWYQFTDKPEHIPHFQKCLRGDNEQADPTDSASYAAGCPVCKSDGSLQSTKYFFILEKCGFWGDKDSTESTFSTPNLVKPFYLLHQPRGNCKTLKKKFPCSRTYCNLLFNKQNTRATQGHLNIWRSYMLTLI